MMFDVCRRAVRRSRSLFAIASGMVVVSCSSAGGSGTADRADTSNSATPVLRTANGQQIFGTGGANSSNAATSPGASPVGATPAESREAQTDPVLVSHDAGAGSSTPPAPRPPPSAGPVPQDPPGAASDDDDDDDDESDDDD